MTAGSAASRRVLGWTPVAPLPASSPTRPTGITGRMSAPPETSSPGVCSFRLPQMCGFRLPLTRQPAGLPPRRHPRPPLAHGVAHRLSGGRRADPLPPRLPPHRRPQPDPRQCPRAGRHAPDRPQDPRHLRPLQHHQRTGTARGRGSAGRLSSAARTGDAPWARAPGQPAPRAALRLV